MKLAKVGNRLAESHKMTFTVDEAVYDHIAGLCTQVDVGARNIDHILDQTVLPELSRQLLEKMTEDEMPSGVTMSLNGADEFTYSFAK